MTVFPIQWKACFAFLTFNACKLECLLEVFSDSLDSCEDNMLLAHRAWNGWALLEYGLDAVDAEDVLAGCLHWVCQKLFAHRTGINRTCWGEALQGNLGHMGINKRREVMARCNWLRFCCRPNEWFSWPTTFSKLHVPFAYLAFSVIRWGMWCPYVCAVFRCVKQLFVAGVAKKLRMKIFFITAGIHSKNFVYFLQIA